MAARRHAAVLTISDTVAGGQREDLSGPAAAGLLEDHRWEIICRDVLPDDCSRIQDRLLSLCSEGGVQLVVTVGGTGLGPRDRTPEAVAAVIERAVPGLAECMRAAGARETPFAFLSRCVAGVRGATLIVTLPGSVKGATESLAAVIELLPHAVDVLSGDTGHE